LLHAVSHASTFHLALLVAGTFLVLETGRTIGGPPWSLVLRSGIVKFVRPGVASQLTSPVPSR